MRTTIVEMFAVAKCAAHPAEFRGFFEQGEWNSRSLRVERNPQARGSSSENRQIKHRKSCTLVKMLRNFESNRRTPVLAQRASSRLRWFQFNAAVPGFVGD